MKMGATASIVQDVHGRFHPIRFFCSRMAVWQRHSSGCQCSPLLKAKKTVCTNDRVPRIDDKAYTAYARNDG